MVAVRLCDGGYTSGLDKRGYGTSKDHLDDALVCMHREYARCGSDIVCAFTGASLAHWASFHDIDIDVALARACVAARRVGACVMTCVHPMAHKRVTRAIDKDVDKGVDKGVVHRFKERCRVLQPYSDIILAQAFQHVEECCHAILAIRDTGCTAAATMEISVCDRDDVSVQECAVRMADAGADIVGVENGYDPFTSLETMRQMRAALVQNGYDPDNGRPVLMCRPLGYFLPDVSHVGWKGLTEYPFALEPRQCTRFDVKHYARKAHELGVGIVGGGEGFEPYHIRAMNEELLNESKKREFSNINAFSWFESKADDATWRAILPATGRPYSSAFSLCSSDWNVCDKTNVKKDRVRLSLPKRAASAQNLQNVDT